MAGSGPAGLFVALSLARKGIRVLVLDKGEDVDESPRAMAFQPCAVAEMMEIGIYGYVQAACIPDATISLWTARTDESEHKYQATISTRDSVKSDYDEKDVLPGINIGQDEKADAEGMLPYISAATPEAKQRDEALYVARSDPQRQVAARVGVWKLALPAEWIAEYEDPELVKLWQSLRPTLDTEK